MKRDGDRVTCRAVLWRNGITKLSRFHANFNYNYIYIYLANNLHK